MKTNKKSQNKKIQALVLGIVLFIGNLFSFGQGTISSEIIHKNDQTFSPYFFINSDDPETDRLPLKKTEARVNVAGVIADVIISQVYENNGIRPIEAIYVFPASTRAAVYAMKMKIGEREIIALVQEKEKARRNYEQAKANGQTASLLEQDRPNVFTMNVANILPGDVIEVELKYTELLIPVEGIYEFVFPTVVGPRYNSGGDSHTPEKWIANPYFKEGQAPNYSFDIQMDLSTGMPLQYLQCNSHDVNINYRGKNSASIRLKNPEEFQGNKDFIVDYRLAGKHIETGLLLFQGEKENFFLAMIQPPERVTKQIITPREYIFIVDVSGSMHGFPLDVSKELMRNLIGDLKPHERFNVLLFAGGSSLFSEKSVAANEENIRLALNFIDKQSGGGGTELLPALKRAMSLPVPENFSRSFVIATDGYVSVERETFEYIARNLGKANFFPFGIGSSVNRYLLEGMAHVGKAKPFVITNQEEARPIADNFRKYVSQPVLTNIEVDFGDFNAYDVEPLSIPDVLAERPVIIFGKWSGKLQGEIALKGFAGENSYITYLDVSESKPDKKNLALRYLWAREKLRLLDDFAQVSHADSALQKKITELGLEYNLLTRFTSFLALDSEMRNSEGNLTTVNQALPLPEGVSNYAVGGVKRYNGTRVRGTTAVYAPAIKSSNNYLAEEVDSEDYDIQQEQVIETFPEYTGGIKKLEEFIKNNLQFPESLKVDGISGTVFVSLLVDKDGTIKEIKILRGLHPDADREAIRVIRLTNKRWKPAESNGAKVAAEVIVPVKFWRN